MRNTVAKKLRKLVNPENPITRRVYRRLKKEYSSLSKDKKAEFMVSLGKSFLKQG
jgi:hypothetical protein